MQMQFTPKQRDAVYAGTKTEHRIPADGECRYRAGHAYRVKVDGDEPPIVVTVVSEPRRQKLGEMRAREAIREGERHLRAFTESWIERHGAHDPEAEVFVLAIAAGDLEDKPRFLARGGPAPICRAPRRDEDGNVIHKPGSPIIEQGTGRVIRESLVLCNRAFAVGQRTCRCGAKRPPESSEEYGYTPLSHRAIDSGEALSDAELEAVAPPAGENERLRDLPRRELMDDAAFFAGGLRQALAEMKERPMPARARKRLALIEREVEKLREEDVVVIVPSEGVC